LGRFIALRSRGSKPASRFDRVRRDAPTLQIHKTKIVLRLGVTLLCSGEKPAEGFGMTLLDAHAGAIEGGQLVLRLRIAGLGEFFQDL
jgi:hypothetical protein